MGERQSVLWPRSLGQQKLCLAVILTAWVSVPYYALQRCAFLPVRSMEPGWIDRVIPFEQQLAWLYLSLFLLIAIAPVWLSRSCDVRRYAVDLAIIALVSHAVFLFWPTKVQRPSGEVTDFAYGLIVGADNSLNAWPSLHASLAIYSVLWCEQLLRRPATSSQARSASDGTGRAIPSLALRACGTICPMGVIWWGEAGAWGWRAGLWLWTLAILYATLALKQHVLVDLLAGAALAGAVFAGSGLWLQARRRLHDAH
jgi:membrane-associated phospholipid phosphatase